MASPDSKIIIVGAGVFGLSTALWLARDGYKHITVFDSCPLDKKNYNPADGCDGASADINKIFRTSYGNKRHYQDLALEAKQIWHSWNEAICKSSPVDLPEGLSPEDKLLDLCGIYFLSAGAEMDSFHKESLEAIEDTKPESRRLHFVKGNAEDEERLWKLDPKWIKPFHMLDALNDNKTNGFLDVQGGINLSDKACTYARFLCEQAGVKFVFGTPHGKLQSLIIEQYGKERKVTGIRTCDGLEHFTDVVVVACGGWTALIIPEAHRTIETTGGTILFIDLPKNRKDLRDKFDPENYPAWAYREGGVSDLTGGNFTGGFPITREGRLKFVFRGRKYTNFQDHPTETSLRISTPRTKYSQNPIHTVPLHGLRLAKEVIEKTFPELSEFGFTDTRLCWYTDSIDNDFVIDYVPGYSDSLFICTGGSGHGFKFLPILGRHVKNQLERVPDQFTQFWKWRAVEEGKNCNGLEEGEDGPRELSRNELAKPHDLSFRPMNGPPEEEPIRQQHEQQPVRQALVAA